MRHATFDAQRLRREAASRHESSGLVAWWARRHNCPETDPRLLELNPGQLQVEYLQSLFERRDEITALLQNPETPPTQRSEAHKQLGLINNVLEDDKDGVTGSDPLVEEWIRDFEEGRVPDLTKGLDTVKRGGHATNLHDLKGGGISA